MADGKSNVELTNCVTEVLHFLLQNTMRIIGGIRGTVVARWTADQQDERSILRHGYYS